MSIVDWPTSLPRVAAVRSVKFHVTRATSSADIIHATCHPSSGDTCHLRIGPSVHRKVQNCMPCVTPWSCHVSLHGPATCPIWTCHVSCTDLPCVLYGMTRVMYGLYGLYGQVQSASKKVCLFGLADRMRYLLHMDSI
jgi:hypothetical protein